MHDANRALVLHVRWKPISGETDSRIGHQALLQKLWEIARV